MITIPAPLPMTKRFCSELYGHGLFDETGQYLCLGPVCAKYEQCSYNEEYAYHERVKLANPPRRMEEVEPAPAPVEVEPAPAIVKKPTKTPRTGKPSRWQIPFNSHTDSKKYFAALRLCQKYKMPYDKAIKKSQEQPENHEPETPLKVGDVVKCIKSDGGRRFYGPARVVDSKDNDTLLKCEETATKNFFWINKACLVKVEQ